MMSGESYSVLLEENLGMEMGEYMELEYVELVTDENFDMEIEENVGMVTEESVNKSTEVTNEIQCIPPVPKCIIPICQRVEVNTGEQDKVAVFYRFLYEENEDKVIEESVNKLTEETNEIYEKSKKGYEIKYMPPVPDCLPLPKFSRIQIKTGDNSSITRLKNAKKLFHPVRQFRRKRVFVVRRRIPRLRRRLLRYKKPLLVQRKPKKKLKITEKLEQRFLRSIKKKTLVTGNFIKCDHLKRLVRREKLKYLVLELFPNKRCFLYIRMGKVRFEYSGVFVESDFQSIDRGEIPLNLLRYITKDKKHLNLIHDFHCIVHIKRYLSEDDDELIASNFTLLKLSNNLIIKINRKNVDNRNYEVLPDRKNESKAFFKVSGPLYLGSNTMLVDVAHYLMLYRSSFDVYSRKDLQMRARYGSRELIGANFLQVLPFYSGVKRKQEFIRLMKEIQYPDPLVLNGTPIWADNQFWIKDFAMFLDKRIIEVPEKFLNGAENIIEVFNIIYPNKYPCGKQRQVYITIFVKDRLFHCCLTGDMYWYNPYEVKTLQMLETKERIDSFIMNVLEIAVRRFKRQLRLTYTSFIELVEIHFFHDNPDYFKIDEEAMANQTGWITYTPFGTTYMTNVKEHDNSYMGSSDIWGSHLVGGKFKVIPRSFVGSNYSYMMSSMKRVSYAVKKKRSIKSKIFVKKHRRYNDKHRLLFCVSYLYFKYRHMKKKKKKWAYRGCIKKRIRGVDMTENEKVKATFEPHRFERSVKYPVKEYKKAVKEDKKIHFHPSLTSEFLPEECDPYEIIPDDDVLRMLDLVMECHVKVNPS